MDQGPILFLGFWPAVFGIFGIGLIASSSLHLYEKKLFLGYAYPDSSSSGHLVRHTQWLKLRRTTPTTADDGGGHAHEINLLG